MSVIGAMRTMEAAAVKILTYRNDSLEQGQPVGNQLPLFLHSVT